MGVADVIRMTKEDYKPQIIINQIRTTQSTFDLTLSDLDMLKTNGVSDSVIAEMQASRPTRAPARVVVRDQPGTVIYDSPPPVIVRPYYAPRPVYVVGGYYRYR
jgi:hypothetical protein